MNDESALLPLMAVSVALALVLARLASGRGLARRDMRRLLGIGAVVGGAWLLLSALQGA
ncbi:MAG TPA: hypothetical protein VFE82_00180 [Ramlibacter sp.]|jgi:hypothetical protein|uniref:hypothetical protein n=1 Tax=Ramlibacter sp. TaxID=1917967 RepID=UPI002D3C6716|nr:hypothetical protein [Ramlibacter sp.]HZY16860.1 hypothetical protein [Ramlibacter sp.]